MRRSVNKGVRASALLLAAGLGVAACGGDEGGNDAAKEDAAGAIAHIKVFQFQPGRLKVAKGAEVKWINDDDIGHTVTSGTREYAAGDTGDVKATNKDGKFDLILDAKGKEVSHTFNEAGTFHYFCDRHPGMEADVVVT